MTMILIQNIPVYNSQVSLLYIMAEFQEDKFSSGLETGFLELKFLG